MAGRETRRYTLPDIGRRAMKRALVLIGLAAATFAAVGLFPREITMFQLSSPAFAPSSTMPKQYTCDGKNVSPPLAWSGVPAGTRSIAVIMDDPDAPAGVWVHWVLYDVPAQSPGVAEDLPKKDALPDGSKQGPSGGVIEFEAIGYTGPCPPKGKPHRYTFTAYALNGSPGIGPRAAKSVLLESMRGKILAQAELVGLYGR
jgi:Raf kinase inhibitor-like YbhB/YbcL family protein